MNKSHKKHKKIQRNILKELLVVGALVIVFIVLGIFLLIHAVYPSTQKIAAVPVALVEITTDGFVPSTLSIHTGTKVVWVNETQLPHQIAADPYPSHSQLPALYAPKALGYKQTYSFIFTKERTINYGDQLNPTWQGTVEVVK